MSDLFAFNHDAAMKSGKMGMQSGVHKAVIESCIRGKSKGGAAYIEFSFETEGGAKANFVTLYISNKEGETIFGHGKFQALLGLLGLTQEPLKWVEKDGKQHCSTLEGKPCQVGLQKVEYLNGSGEKKFKFEITHFFDLKTGCTYTELKDNKAAKSIAYVIEDVLIKDAAEHNFKRDAGASSGDPRGHIPTPDDSELLPF